MRLLALALNSILLLNAGQVAQPAPRSQSIAFNEGSHKHKHPDLLYKGVKGVVKGVIWVGRIFI